MSVRIRRLFVGLGAVGATLVVLVAASCGTLRAGLILRDALGPAQALEEGVAETLETIPSRSGEPVRARLVRPVDQEGPLPALLLVHGAHADGWEHPAYVALARALAVRGATVAALELPTLREFRLDASDPVRVADAASWLAQRGDLAAEGRVGLIGISVGGSYALVAASDPRIAPDVSCVLAFGAYPDLEDLLRRWLTKPRADATQLLDPLTVGRRRVLLGNLAHVVPTSEHAAVEAVLRALIEGREPPADPPTPSEASQRVLAAARSTAPLEPADAERLLAHFATETAALSPSRAAGTLTAPVYLLQGVGDPIVTVADAERLRDLLAARGVDVRLHVTDVFTHVDAAAAGGPSLLDAWPLLRFLAGPLGDAGL